jgi:fatty-acyl-CoA synthase
VRGIGQWVAKRAQLSNNKIALIYKDRQFTYSQLNNRINRLANGLAQVGIQKGTRVAVFLLNGTEILEVMFACAKIGAIFVPINFRLSVEEVEYILKDSGAAVFIYHREYEQLAAEVCKKNAMMLKICVGDGVAEDTSYEVFLAKHADTEPAIDVAGDEVHMIMYTSGTTGRPKGAMLTHANTFWNIIQILIAQPILDTDTTFTVAPCFIVEQ